MRGLYIRIIAAGWAVWLFLAGVLCASNGFPVSYEGRNDRTMPGVASALSASTEPVVLWNRTLGGLTWDVGYDVVKSTEGGYVVLASTNSYGAGGVDAWLIRLDDAGRCLWNRTFGGATDDYGRSVVECSDGGFALGGTTASYGVGAVDFWLVRTDENGNHLWNCSYGSANSEWGWPVLQCADGGFLIGGNTNDCGGNGTCGFSMWLVRTDASGSRLWNQTYGIWCQEEATEFVECADGGFAVSGKICVGESGMATWLVRTDAAGNQLWNRTYGTQLYGDAAGIIRCSTGGFALVGTAIYGIGGGYEQDLVVVRVSEDGGLVWTRRVSSPASYDGGTSLIECANGGFAVVGWHSERAWLVRLNANGTILWDQIFGGDEGDNFFEVLECNPEDFILVGATRSFGWGPGTGQNDLWLLRVSFASTPSARLPIEAIVAGVVIIVATVAVGVFVARRRRRTD